MARKPTQRREAMLPLPGMVASDDAVLQPKPAGANRRTRHKVPGVSKRAQAGAEARTPTIPPVWTAERSRTIRGCMLHVWFRTGRVARKGIHVMRHMMPELDARELDALWWQWVAARNLLGERDSEL